MLHRTFPLWLAIGFMLIVFTGYAMADDKKVYYSQAPASPLIKDTREPLALPPPLVPTPVKVELFTKQAQAEAKLPSLPMSEDRWSEIFFCSFVACLAYAIFTHTQLRRLKREHTEREWTTKAGLWPEQRSLRELFQHMSDDTAATKPFIASANRPRNQQPRFPTRQQPQYPRRDGRERYLTDPIEDQPRHPDGSALDAVARFYSTRERDSSSGE